MHFSGKMTTCTVCAFGRPFQLGNLYDCRSESIITGLNLWDKGTIRALTHSVPEEGYKSCVVTDDELDSELGIDADARLSILSGLIDVYGSAEFLKRTGPSDKLSRLSLLCRATSRHDQLDGSLVYDARQQQLDTVIKQDTATHVVIGILYGTDGLFAFDHENATGITYSKEMGAAIYKLGQYGHDNLESVNCELTAEESSVANRLSCTFYGDIFLDQLPSTYDEAFVALQKLRNHRLTRMKAVPKMVCLLPLSCLYQYNRPTAVSVRNINDGTAGKIQGVIKELQQIRSTAMDLKAMCSFPVPPLFDCIQSQFSEFLSLLDVRLLRLAAEMRHLLPKCRGSHSKRDELLCMFESMIAPPYDPNGLNLWLQAKKKEVDALQTLFSLVSSQEGTTQVIVIFFTTSNFIL